MPGQTTFLYRRSLAAALLCMGLATPPVATAAEQRATIAQVNTAQWPLALCNNGAPATYHYRLSQHDGSGIVDYRKKWLVVLSGGGKCDSKATCLARWRESPKSGPGGRRHDQDEGPGDHFNMVPDGVNQPGRDFDGKGILDFDGEPAPGGGTVVGENASPFRGPTGPDDGFNRVWIKYCSSDTWQGLGTRVNVRAQSFHPMPFDSANGPLDNLYFGGARIVDAVIQTILGGAVPGAGADHVPDAIHGEIVLAGSSAGGVGTIRNLDHINEQVQHLVPGIKVYGVADAMSGVGILPDVFTAAGTPEDAALFYANGDMTKVRTDYGCDAIESQCHATGTIVVRDHITTPYMVVQQAYDFLIHEAPKTLLTQAIRKGAPLVPALPVLQRLVAATHGDAGLAAELYIRHAVTAGAPQIGWASSNPAALYVPNFAEPWHQVMANSPRYFVTPTEPVPMWLNAQHKPEPGPQRLGPVYAGSNVSLPMAIGNFRQCVKRYAGNPGLYSHCIETVNTGQGMVQGNARVINSTALR